MRARLLAALPLLVACAGQAAPTRAPATTPSEDPPSQPATPEAAPAAARSAPNRVPAERYRFFRSSAPGESAPVAAGITFSTSADGSPGPVRPAPVDLASLPRLEVPPPLDAKEAPNMLPPSAGPTRLVVDPVPQTWSAGDARSAYVRVDSSLGRLHIGTVNFDRGGGDRVYRSCSMRSYGSRTLIPARWSLLERDGEGVVFRVFDGWFDHHSCEASLVRRTDIRPAPLLGGLLYAYRTPCDDGCGGGERVVILSPAVGRLGAAAVGGQAKSSQDTYVMVEFPVRRGGSASFSGNISSHTLSTWLTTLGVGDKSHASAQVGVEITHAVRDPEPTAIAYASIVTR